MTVQTAKFRIIAAFYLILMCVQYVPWEGWGASPVKVTAMCIAPVFFLISRPVASIAIFWDGLYLIWCWAVSHFHSSTPRIDTLGYMAMFWSCYMVFYHLVVEQKVFSMEFFEKLMKYLLSAYIVVLIVQQIFSLVGLGSLPLINSMGFCNMQNVFKCQY